MYFVGSLRLAATQLGLLFVIASVGPELLLFIFLRVCIEKTLIFQILSSFRLLHFAFCCLWKLVYSNTVLARSHFELMFKHTLLRMKPASDYLPNRSWASHNGLDLNE